MDSILIPVDAIVVHPERRSTMLDNVRKLAKSISEVGLLNPITIDREYTLVAGLHRLEAVKMLAWTEIECHIISLDGLLSELAQIDENFVRSDIPTIERNDMVLRRKEIYETLHPDAKSGGDRRSKKAVEKNRSAKCTFDPPPVKSFAEDTAEKLGVDSSTVRRRVQAAKNTTEEAKRILKETNTNISQKDALGLSRMEPEQQSEAAGMLSRGEIQSVDEYLKQRETGLNADVSECEAGKDGEVLASPQNNEEPDQVKESDKPSGFDGQGIEGFVPFRTDSRPYTSFEEAVAELKDPNRDRSCTTDSFLAEITAFVRKFHREIEWYDNPYYEAVYPTITPEQLDYLREQMNLICSAADNLYNTVERIARQ